MSRFPPAKAQAGKIQLKLQNRLVEYEAVTSSPERLATGTKVRVVGIAGNTLEVEPLHGRQRLKFQVPGSRFKVGSHCQL